MDTQTSASSSQERKAYEPASVKVIEITSRVMLCNSTGSTQPPGYGGDPGLDD